MTDRASPVVRRRRLAAELRRLRVAAGKTLDDVAEYLECSATKVSRIESGQVGARIQDVRDMLDLYGVSGSDREAMLDLVRQARQKGWWHAYGDMLPDAFLTMIGLEDEATTIWTFECHLVPGLAQTEAYSRAIMSSRRDHPAELVERGMQLRTRRKAVLNRDDPPAYWAVIDEAALRRPVGGREVMDEQYAHLITMAALPDVTIQVLPFEAGAHAGGSFPFVILGFADLTEPKVVYVEHLTGAFYINLAEDVGVYLAQFDNLRGRALDPAASVDFIRRLRQQSLAGHDGGRDGGGGSGHDGSGRDGARETGGRSP